MAWSTVDTVTDSPTAAATEVNGGDSAAVVGVKPTVLPELAPISLSARMKPTTATISSPVVIRNAFDAKPGA